MGSAAVTGTATAVRPWARGHLATMARREALGFSLFLLSRQWPQRRPQRSLTAQVRAVAKIKIKWVRSQIGFAQKQGQTIRALGLRRLQQTVEHDDSPTIRGMVHKIRHMVQVELGDQEGS